MRYRSFLDDSSSPKNSCSSVTRTDILALKKDLLVKQKSGVAKCEQRTKKVGDETDALAENAEKKQLCFLSESNAKRKQAEGLKSELFALKSKVRKLEDGIMDK